MNDKEIYSSALAISAVHTTRIEFALEKLKTLLPFDASRIQNLSTQDLLYLELFTNRFAKLQDYMGSTLFDMCIQHFGDVTDGLTIIDKVNKLVKHNIIESEELWRELRKARNHILHEYPSRPDLTAQYINATIDLTPKLLESSRKISQCLSK